MFEHDDLYTIKEVSEILNIPKVTIYKRLEKRQLPVFQSQEDGLYRISGDIANRVKIYDRPGPRTTKLNIVTNEKPQRKID